MLSVFGDQPFTQTHTYTYISHPTQPGIILVSDNYTQPKVKKLSLYLKTTNYWWKKWPLFKVLPLKHWPNFEKSVTTHYFLNFWLKTDEI